MKVVVVGAGHNGLVCACYLARAGLDVLVLEQSDRPGGGSRTEETVPRFRFDTHSVAHNIINMTPIPRELDLAGAGLEYREMDPFAVALFADGRRVRFHRSIEQTVRSIAEIDRAEADAYAEFMEVAVPVVDLMIAGMQAGGSTRETIRLLGSRLPRGLRAFGREPLQLVSELLGPYGRVLDSRLRSDLTRGPIAAFAAHASAGPSAAGGAPFAFWQAAYHRFGQWHAVGGSGALTAALAHRLENLGGRVRCEAAVVRIDAAGGRVRAAVLADGERIDADAVITAMDPKTALLELTDPPLSGRVADQLRATHRSNSVQALVHVAVEGLPPYTGARPGDWNGLQSYVDGVDALSRSFAAADDRRLAPAPAAAYAFTTSALDDTLAPPGHHTMYLACPAAPYLIDEGWQSATPRLAEDLIDQVEVRAPGFRDTIRGVHIRTPADMAAELHWPGAHPMYLDLSPDQLAVMRPTAALASHRTPIAGLYISGAGTAPVGGISGSPGRAAAHAVLKDRTGTPRRR
ncbi:MAG: NAD(P)/FAD-dependent oxidoreductase [Actinomycetota bacterium]|nr:NAD(P)/FAD-dependent oxidoreductase [Actinomycetota bacterium]